jgi:CRP/FNR family transcriptional regulator, nitrogen fixation regulation protein
MYLVAADPAPIVALSMAAVMERIGAPRKFAKGSKIFGQGEATDLMHGVAKGAVRTTRILADGRRQIGDFYVDGEMIGLEPRAVHRFSAEALTDCSIYLIRRTALSMACQNGALAHVLLEATQRELDRTQKHLLVLECKSARERVASFLLGFASCNTADFVTLPMGRQDMADYLGLTLETVSRMVSHLQAIDAVKFNGSREFRVQCRDALETLAA